MGQTSPQSTAHAPKLSVLSSLPLQPLAALAVLSLPSDGCGFVSVIISIVICPLSDPLPVWARKRPPVSVFDGAPSSSSSEKTKAKQAHNESDVSLLTLPLTSPSHFLSRPISVFPLLFIGNVAGTVPLRSASRGVWPAPLGVSRSSAAGKADRAPLAPAASSTSRLREAWPRDTRARDQTQRDELEPS